MAIVPAEEISPPRRLNIGVVGIGRMGQRHALNILHHVPRANLLCVCSPAKSDLEWADKHLKPYGVQIYETFEEMIETPGLEAVVIASVTALHAKHTVESLERGIHVLCEKPVTTDLDELSKVIAKAESRPEVKVMVGFTRRFDGDYKYAREKVKAGDIGTPIVLRSQGCELLDKSGFFIQYAKVSGGIFVDSAIHDIDLTLSFFGDDVKPKALWATGTAAMHKELEEFHDADNAVGVVEFWGGKIAHYYHSRTTVHGYDNVTEIFGTNGKLSINAVPRKNRVEISDATGVRNEVTPSWIDRYEGAFVTELNEFTAAVLDNTELPMKLTTALTSLKIALGLQESLVTGKKIEFDEQGNRITP
ncbi:hypothetical protein VTN77DRAFT_6972 [Rasamsonia byssochlamydoides]|uniref:uncharacterized protein n=1 Tax=Rasamsonia byssochlamydoides TaxID=89139 RepID=UPI0037423A57